MTTGYTPKFASILEQRQSALRRQLEAVLPPSQSDFIWEVGCGHGHFLTAYAAAHPRRTCIGIDLVSERIERALKKRDRAKLSNLHFVQAEARLFLETLPAHARLSTIFVLFPDPWPKLRHNKHRIIQPGFLASAAARAATECPLYFRTDFAPYFGAARDVFAADRYWRLVDEPWPFEFETVFQQRAEAFDSLVARCKTHPLGTNPDAAGENVG
jgi:tRNA (guanine-N7-)-methyltransferase